ncbi:MAG: hypothetical protein M3N29_00545 [Chloroflexota bacterium]|nr:hypothetical protein [Chloroflexota bacterium]
MTDSADAEERDREQGPRARIESARDEAAAYVVQRTPVDDADVGADEERILDAVDEARTEDDPDRLEELAEQAEEGRDDIRRQLYGKGSVNTDERG